MFPIMSIRSSIPSRQAGTRSPMPALNPAVTPARVPAVKKAAALKAAAAEKAGLARAAAEPKPMNRLQAPARKAVLTSAPAPRVTVPAAESSKVQTTLPPQAAQAAKVQTGPGLPTAVPLPAAGAAARIKAAAAPAAGPVVPAGSLVAAGGRVSIDILQSESAYENKIYWSSDNFATRHLIGVDNRISTVDLGDFAAGTRIDFGIDNGQGHFFRTGAATSNADGQVHAQVQLSADGQHAIGFEDLFGGGDRDFNDAIVRVRGLTTPTNVALAPPLAPATPEALPPAESVAPPAGAATGNHSGLADGSNPGQGAGRANSPNGGTLNPNQATNRASESPATVARNSKMLAESYGSFASMS